ncbi:hypothetical protein BD408DRAFT_456328, partial [Parasitella parasitica]
MTLLGRIYLMIWTDGRPPSTWSLFGKSKLEQQVAYGENIQDNVDQENDGSLESSSSATMTPFIDNNTLSPTLNRTMDNQMPTTPWIIRNTDLFQ